MIPVTVKTTKPKLTYKIVLSSLELLYLFLFFFFPAFNSFNSFIPKKSHKIY